MSAWFYRDSHGLAHWVIWTTDIVLLLGAIVFFLWIRWSLRELTRPRPWTPIVSRIKEDEANVAWATFREEAYDAALLIAFHNGDLVDAMKERAQVTGDAFRGLGRSTLEAVAPARALGDLLRLDPYSRRV